MKLRRKTFDLPAYTDRVVAILSDEFGWDERTEAIAQRELGRRTDGFRAPFEFVCDDPASARYRLKHDAEAGPYGLRIAFYPLAPDPAPDGPGIARAWSTTARLHDALAASS